MKTGDTIMVQASETLGTPAEPAVVIRVLFPRGNRYYPDGLLIVRVFGRYTGWDGTVDFSGRVYSGPPTEDGRLTMFP